MGIELWLTALQNVGYKCMLILVRFILLSLYQSLKIKMEFFFFFVPLTGMLLDSSSVKFNFLSNHVSF